MNRQWSGQSILVVLVLASGCFAPVQEGGRRTDAGTDAGVLLMEGKCHAGPARLVDEGFASDEEKRVVVDDVTGDGQSDTLRIVAASTGPRNLEIAPGLRLALQTRDSFELRVMLADLNADGRQDLVAGDVAAGEVAVFFAPLRQSRSWAEAELRFSNPPGAGLSSFFGSSFLVTDLNLDGHLDLLVASPGQPGCLGERQPAAFYGPFSRGILEVADASVLLSPPQEEPSCLGKSMACVKGGITLSTIQNVMGGCVFFALPLSSNAPGSCVRDGG